MLNSHNTKRLVVSWLSKPSSQQNQNAELSWFYLSAPILVDPPHPKKIKEQWSLDNNWQRTQSKSATKITVNISFPVNPIYRNDSLFIHHITNSIIRINKINTVLRFIPVVILVRLIIKPRVSWCFVS